MLLLVEGNIVGSGPGLGVQPVYFFILLLLHDLELHLFLKEVVVKSVSHILKLFIVLKLKCGLSLGSKRAFLHLFLVLLFLLVSYFLQVPLVILVEFVVPHLLVGGSSFRSLF